MSGAQHTPKGQAAPASGADWLQHLQELAARYGPANGVNLAQLDSAQLWGVYRFLVSLHQRQP